MAALSGDPRNPMVDVLIPTYRRPAALAVTLASLCAQHFRGFRLVISDQTEDDDPVDSGEVQAVLRLLRAQGHEVVVHKHLPRRGLAEHRQFLLERARTRFALFLDDDIIVAPEVIANLVRAIGEECCGFVGQAVIGLSYIDDRRPEEQAITFWDGPVTPEVVAPGSLAWKRHLLHNAANLFHVQNHLQLTPDIPRKYKVAWVGGCVMFDTGKLREAGGFNFWRELPPVHCGEDVLAQLRVMARYGGCGLIPSGVYHQELPTTVEDRDCDAPRVLGLTIQDKEATHGQR